MQQSAPSDSDHEDHMHLDAALPTVELIRELGRLERGEAIEYAEQIQRLLHHEDQDVREEAVRALFVRAKYARAREALLALLAGDPAVEVRCTAAYGVAATSTPALLAQDSRLLTAVIEDDSQDSEVRGSAYDALLILHRKAQFPSKKQEFAPERDIDWGWFLSGSWRQAK